MVYRHPKMKFSKTEHKYLACVWGPNAYKITKRRSFKTEAGALRFAERQMEKEPGIHEVAILVKDKSNKEWPWRVIHRVKNDRRTRIREAAKREAADKRSKKRKKGKA